MTDPRREGKRQKWREQNEDFAKGTERVLGQKFQKTRKRFTQSGGEREVRPEKGERKTEPEARRNREAVGEATERAGREERIGDKEEWPFISPPKLIEATSA